MWELDCEESWALKNWCLWTVVLEKSPMDCKEIQPVHPKGDQSWVFIGGTDVEAEAPILWPCDAKNWFIWKDPDAGKDWKQEKKGTIADEITGWHHQLNGHEFGWTLGVGDGQGGLACCGSWGHKELDTTKWLNWLNWTTWNTVNQHDWGGLENCKGCELSTEWIVLRCTGYTFVHNSLTRISDKTKRGKEGEIKCEPTKYQNRE